MGEDREILREIWDGRIPVCITLASEDSETFTSPDPHFLLIPRISYLSIVLGKVQNHFMKSLSEQHKNKEMWLEYQGIPLKWHYPIGLLYDLHTGGSTLPWPITAHFSNFPEKQLTRCPNGQAVESHFLSSVKEADAFKHRGQVMKNMQMQDHKTLWNGLCNDRFDQFWAVNRKLMDTEDGFKHIPFRIYISSHPPIQRLQKTHDENGQQHTLGDLLTASYPQIKDNDRVLVHGIEPPLDTPILWMSEHLSHPDNFLHIVISSSSS